MHFKEFTIQECPDNGGHLIFGESCTRMPHPNGEQLNKFWFTKDMYIERLEFKLPSKKLVDDTWMETISRLPHMLVDHLMIWNIDKDIPFVHSPYFNTIHKIIGSTDAKNIHMTDELNRNYTYNISELQTINKLFITYQKSHDHFFYCRKNFT